MNRLQDKIAFISGGVGAIGQAIAQRLAEEGATPVLGDLHTPDDSRYNCVHLDVTSQASWRQALGAVVEQYGQVDVLVNNAGAVSPEPQNFEDVELQEWQRLFSVNAEGVFLGTKEGIRCMKGNRETSRIVNIGSIAGYYGIHRSAAYGASKATVKSISRTAAMSAATLGYDMRINSIHPGYVWTPLVKNRLVLEYGSEESAQQALKKMNPLGRLVQPADIAAAVAFLGSSDANMMHGADLVIDGGRLIQ